MQNQSVSDAQHGAIAVIGMACVFPGANDLHSFWQLLKEGRCAIKSVPDNRWDPADLPDYAAAFAGFIDEADCFDPGFFGISRKEAAVLDPRQRLTLQVAWRTLEDAGIAADSLKEEKLGVFIGAVNGEFLGNFSDTVQIEPHMGIGTSNAIIANRISHVLGARGPSMAIDTACSSSLLAVHQACRSLQTGDSALTLAGGVSLMLRPDSSVALGKGGMLARDGLCKAFDASADGYGRGEGCGLVLLKRLDDALAAGDRIHAVIQGSASNHDGVSNGITAPNGLAQESLIQSALRDAGLHSSKIQYVETHGTGTLLGDPTEARALGKTLGRHRETPLLIGSVKTNIGHLEAAAGVAGLIKLILAIKHRKIPASLHYYRPNPYINFEQLKLEVVGQPCDWPEPETGSARAGSVSAFGFGGTNCHIVVQEFVANARQPETTDTQNQTDVLLLSAASAQALTDLAQSTATQFKQAPSPDFPAVCALSRHGRAHLRHRLALLATDAEQAAHKLEEFLTSGFHNDIVDAVAARRPPKLAFLCPGQGSQRPGMARALLGYPVFRATIEEADAILGWPLSRLLQDENPSIDFTDKTQPALLAVGVGLARLLAQYGIKPNIAAGHSLGEYTATVIAGGIGYADALRLVAARGKLMQQIPTPCAMAAIRTDEQTVMAYLPPEVSLAAVNGPQSVTISGPKSALNEVCATLQAQGIRVLPLRVNSAFHSSAMDSILDDFADALEQVQWQPLQIPVCSNLTGELLPAGHVYNTGYWLKHTREAVRFADVIQTLDAAGMETAVELGAVPILSGMLEDNNAKMRALACLQPGRDDREAFLKAVASLHVQGFKVNFPASTQAAAGDCLPLYPFAKESFPLRIGCDSFALGNRAFPALAAETEIPANLPAAPLTALDREGIRARIIDIVAALLATDKTQVDTLAPLLEIGADSLILMQAVGRIEKEFAVKIPVRAFFEDLTTIDAVAHYLADKQAQPVHTASQAQPITAKTNAATAATPPVQRSGLLLASGTMSQQQLSYLEQFSADYCARTQKSKQQAQKYRHVLADSRASAGFRFSIKEMLYPIVGQRAQGSKIWDIDDNEYIDISMGFGVQFFGHEPEFLKQALAESLSRGIRIGPQSDMAGEVAELISELTGVERVAFCSSGTEAVMTALRLARTASGRKKIAVFRNSYHGHFDGVLGEIDNDPWAVAPRVPGITQGMVDDLAFFDYGSDTALEQLRPHIDEFAAVLVEPVQSRNPDLQPREFLHTLRRMTQSANTVLIFDEVLVGFRIHPGGAQAHFGVQADLVTYGKIVGGGLPIGIIAGRSDIMAGIDGGFWQYGDASFPAAEATFFAGTFNKHPLTMAAARSVLTEIKAGGIAVYQDLNAKTAHLAAKLNQVFSDAEAPIDVRNFGSLFRFAFKENLDPFFYHLLHRGLYVWEGRNLFLSTAHTDRDVDAIVERVEASIKDLAKVGFIPPQAPIAAKAPIALPISAAQKQLATLAALSERGASAYLVPVALELQGKIDHDRLHRAVETVVRRHGALRAAIDLEAGVQRIAETVPVQIQRIQLDESALDAALRASLQRTVDLSQAGTLRVDLFEITEERAVMLLSAHHVFIDGLSMQILCDEFAGLYADNALAPAPDYAALAGRLALLGKSEADRSHKQFWLQKLASAPNGIDLPCMKARPALRGFHGARVLHNLDQAALRGLETKAVGLGMSLTMALIAAFAGSLRYSGAARDMVLGIPYSGRDSEDDLTPGYCAHLLPLRLQLPANAGTETVLREVKRELLDAFAHAGYPLSQVLEDLQIQRDPARPPLINVTFNVDKLGALPTLPGLSVKPFSLPTLFSRFDIGCNLLLWQDGARIELDYDSDLFSAEAMQGLLDSFVAMIERFSGADQAFDDRDGQRMRWLPPRTGLPQTAGLLDRFRHAVQQAPEDIAVQVDNAPGITRLQLAHWAEQIAGFILSSAKGQGPVLLLLGRSLAMPAAMLGTWQAGRAYLPVDTELPAARILELIRLAKPACVLAHADSEHQGLIESFAELQLPVKLLPATPVAHETGPLSPLAQTPPESCAYQLFTSGSTGKPKLVAIPHRAVAHYLDSIIEALALKPAMRYAVVSTFAADLGLTAVLPALFHQGSLLITSSAAARDADRFAGLMQTFATDLLKIVPSHLEALLSAGQQAHVLPKTHLVLGGEAASAGLLAQLRDIAADCEIFNHFGPTEATIGVMIGRWQRDEGDMRFTQPLGRSRLFILDAGAQPCAIGEAGEIHIGGPGLALGYLDQAATSPSPFMSLDVIDGEERLYRTGDLAVLHKDGRIQLLGRRDEQIKIRGYRIEPAEIVAALTALPQIRAAAAILHCPEQGRPYLLAYIVPALAGAELDTDAVLNELKQTLPAYMLPTALIPVSSLPVTGNGKLDKAALPLPPETNAPDPVDMAEVSDAQAVLLTLWRELLGNEGIGLQQDFFQAGGDSILAIQMIARLRQAGWQAKAGELYENPVLSQFAACLAPAGAAERTAAAVEGECSLLPSQLRLWRQMRGFPQHYNLSVGLEMAAWVTPALLGQALHVLVLHHDALRLRFTENEGRPHAYFGEALRPALVELPLQADPVAALNELQASLRPEQGNLLAAAWLPGQAANVVLVVHHLVSDGISMQILLQDLHRALTDLHQGRSPGIQKHSCSVQDWAKHLLRQANQDVLLEQTEFWEICGSIPVPEIPGYPDENPAEIIADEALVTARLPAQDTARLLKTKTEAYGAEDILIAAIVLALADWNGDALAYLELEGHGRQLEQTQIDASRTVGWFTQRFPAWFDLSDVAVSDAPAAVAMQRRDIPMLGVGYGLLSYLGPKHIQARLAEGNLPQISVNYLGQILAPETAAFSVASWAPARTDRGDERAGHLPRAHRLSLEAMVIDGCLELEWRFNARVYGHDAMQARLDSVLCRLQEILTIRQED